MNYTDYSAGNAEYTIYITPAGKDLNGEPLYRFGDFCTVRLNDATDSTGTFVMPILWENQFGDAFDNGPRVRFEQVSGAIPAPQSTDLDQRALHFVGPL